MKKQTSEKEMRLLKNCVKYDKLCEELIRQYWYMVKSIVKRVFIRKNAPLIKEELEDARQDVFVRLFQNDKKLLRDFKPDMGSNLAYWIVIIATGTTLNYLNKKGWPLIKNQLDIEHIIGSEIKIDERIDLYKLMKKLSLFEQFIMKLYRFGWSSKEIGELTDKTEGAVNNIIYRSKKKLKNILHDQYRN